MNMNKAIVICTKRLGFLKSKTIVHGNEFNIYHLFFKAYLFLLMHVSISCN